MMASAAGNSEGGHSFTGLTVEQLSYGVGMTGVARRFVDEVEGDPTEVPAFCPAIASRRLREKQRVDGGIGVVRLLPIGGDGFVEAHVISRVELKFATAHLGIAETPLDPPPLDIPEMVDDTDERYQFSIGGPAGLSVVESLRVPDDGASEVAKPLEEHHFLIRAAGGKANVLGCHERTLTNTPRSRSARPAGP